MDKLEYLITGCGRSGTGYFAKMLTQNNIKCGHEKYYGSKPQKTIENGDSESSWFAVPYIKNHLDSKIIKTFRNPILNIKSTYTILLFSTKKSNAPSQKHIIKNIPNIIIKDEDMIKNAALYYIKWNLLFDSLIENEYYELIHFDSLINNNYIFLYNKKIKTLNKIVNSKQKEKENYLKQDKNLNISQEQIIYDLKKLKLYNKLMDVYNNMLNHKFRRV